MRRSVCSLSRLHVTQTELVRALALMNQLCPETRRHAAVTRPFWCRRPSHLNGDRQRLPSWAGTDLRTVGGDIHDMSKACGGELRS